MTDAKLSRTQRAINAKDERFKKIDAENENSSEKKKVLQEMVLKRKPFQSNIGEKKATRLKSFQLLLIL